MLQTKNVTKIFGKQKALNNISLSIESGEFVVIMGPSGSGKSTLLNIMSGIDKPNQGYVAFNKMNMQDLPEKEIERIRQKDMGFVFQDYQLLNTLTAQENIALPLTIQKVNKHSILSKTMDYMEMLNIEKVANKFPENLSGGERQRIALARALVTKPKVLFADEPTGALDSKNAYELLQMLTQQNEAGQTIVMVSHDPFTASFASRVVFIKDGTVYHTLHKGDTDRKEFFEQIIQVTSMLGGEFNVI